MNLPNTGQVTTLPDGAITECMGIADADGVHARDRVAVPSILGEYLRRINVSQELTVDAALERRPHDRASRPCWPIRWSVACPTRAWWP